MRNLNLYSTILFQTVLGSLLLPWVSIIRDWPFALSDLTIALSKFNIVPTEHYVQLVVGAAVLGAFMPNVVQSKRTRFRIVFASAGLLMTLAMNLHFAEPFNAIDSLNGDSGTT